MIKSIICENTDNSDAGCSSNGSLKKVNSQDLRLDVEYISKLQSVQALIDRLSHLYGQIMPDYQ